MFRTSIILPAAVLLACIALTALMAQTPEKEIEVLSIELACNGFPGTDQTEKTKQQVCIKDNMLFMEDTQTKNIFIMRSDSKKAWEIDAKKKLYLEREYSYFDSLKSGKNAAEVKTGTKDEKKEINGFKCYPVEISSNGQVLIKLWLTNSMKAPGMLVDFYSKFGGFSDKVVAELAKIADMPVVFEAQMRFGLIRRQVTMEINKVEKKKVPAKQFDLPEGVKKGLEAISIEQVCDGFPGTNQKTDSKQKVIIHENRIYMENAELPNRCIVRGDKKLMWEINPAEKYYDIRHYSYFNKLKKDKEATRKTAVKQLNAIKDVKLRKKYAPKVGILLDKNGWASVKVVAKTEKTNEKKTINDFDCYHVKIHGDTTVVFDLWLTSAMKAPKSMIDFYKTLGCFPDEVVKEVQKIKDFPVSLKAKLDFGALRREVTCKISKVTKIKVTEAQFELPNGVVKRNEYPPPANGGGGPKGECTVCGKEIDPNAKTTGKYPHRGVWYLFCSKECRDKFIKELGKARGDAKKALENIRKEQAKSGKK